MVSRTSDTSRPQHRRRRAVRASSCGSGSSHSCQPHCLDLAANSRTDTGCKRRTAVSSVPLCAGSSPCWRRPRSPPSGRAQRRGDAPYSQPSGPTPGAIAAAAIAIVIRIGRCFAPATPHHRHRPRQSERRTAHRPKCAASTEMMANSKGKAETSRVAAAHPNLREGRRAADDDVLRRRRLANG